MVQNSWTNFLALSEVMELDDLFEYRMENDSSGKILYVGMAQNAATPTDEPLWYIIKLNYDGNGFLSYKQLPVNGAGFIYVWDDRATYF